MPRNKSITSCKVSLMARDMARGISCIAKIISIHYNKVMCELLSPAGNIESLNAAVNAGCDAVYLGIKSFNARMRTTNFAFNQLQAATDALHNRGKKIYVTVNTVIIESELERLYRLLHYLDRIGVDAIIVQDFATIRMAKEFFPNLELHASTQMNVESVAAVKLLQSNGVKRAVLARELSLSEITKIKQETSAALEVFVHGALCISESGLCQFSSYLGGKSANRGQCTQACRRLYSAQHSEGVKTLYYFSPRDLCLIEKIPDLIAAGVDSFKIEGRMKSAEYVGAVTKAYRYVIDNYKNDKAGSIETAKRILSQDFARDKTTYFFDCTDCTSPSVEKSTMNPSQAGGTGIYMGHVTQTKVLRPNSAAKEASSHNKNDTSGDNTLMATVSSDNYDPVTGDTVRIHHKDDTGRVSHKITLTKVIDDKYFFDTDPSTKKGDDVYLLQIKSTSKHNPNILPHDLKKYNEQPRDEILPIMDLTVIQDKYLKPFPAGIYVKVSSLRDMFIAQSLNPVRVLLEWNSDTKKEVLSKKMVLPFSKRQIFIALDPFCTPSDEDELSRDIDSLIEDGYTLFVANNLAHLAILKNAATSHRVGEKPLSLTIIAGQYLYTFNRWAASMLENCDVLGFTSPLENSKKNLMATFERSIRNRVLLTVFSYPTLFRIRMSLGDDYDFTYFCDKEGEEFRLARTPDGSFVTSELPFSILDKITELNKDGFSRFLIDFSKTQVTKNQLKNITASMQKGLPLPDSNRYNFQKGFFIQRDNK